MLFSPGRWWLRIFFQLPVYRLKNRRQTISAYQNCDVRLNIGLRIQISLEIALKIFLTSHRHIEERYEETKVLAAANTV
jgi:hypothetical protein